MRVFVINIFAVVHCVSATHGWSAHGGQHHGRVHSAAHWHADTAQTGAHSCSLIGCASSDVVMCCLSHCMSASLGKLLNV